MTANATLIRRCATAALLELRRTALLQACLLDGEQSRRAWRSWLAEAGDLKAFFRRDGAPRALLSLLYGSARRNDVALDPPTATYLKTAYVRDCARSETYTRVCSEILERLDAASLPVAVVRGNALAESVYADPLLRHSGSIVLLVRNTECRAAAVECLIAGEQVAHRAGAIARAGVADMAHSSGLPVELRSCLFHQTAHTVDLERVWARAAPTRIAGSRAHVLDPATSLVEVCGRAWLSPSRSTLVWLCDAWLLIRKGAIDWEWVIDLARETRLALPVEIGLSYLADDLTAPVPREVIAALRAEPCVDQFETYLAEALRLQPSGARLLLGHMSAWRERLWLGARLLVPPMEYLRSSYGTSSRPLGQWRHARRVCAGIARAGTPWLGS